MDRGIMQTLLTVAEKSAKKFCTIARIWPYLSHSHSGIFFPQYNRPLPPTTEADDVLASMQWYRRQLYIRPSVASRRSICPCVVVVLRTWTTVPEVKRLGQPFFHYLRAPYNQLASPPPLIPFAK